MPKERGRFKRATGSFFYIDQASDAIKGIGASGNRIVKFAKSLLVPKPTVRTETFEEAMKRLNLKEADLQRRAKELKTMRTIYLAIGLAVVAYAVYLAVTGSVAAILTVAISVIVFVLAFREHFRYMQIKRRKLGGTIKLPFQLLTRGGKKK